METHNYIDDIKEIKEIMNRSSRYISLSGISGVFAGIFALGGAYLAYTTVYSGQDYLNYRTADLTTENILTLVAIALVTIVLTVIAGIYFTTKASKKNNQKVWDYQTKRLLINLAIPLVSGGLFCLIMLVRGYVGLLAPLTLIFYGLSLVNASKYTLPELRSLGIMEIAIGLIATYFIGYGLLFWALGFGILHIIYGIVMHLKYKS